MHASRGWLAVMAVLASVQLAACAQVSPVPVAKIPAATASSTPGILPAPTPSPTPAPFLRPPAQAPRASVFGTCRVPVLVGGPDFAAPAGWLSVPSGAFTPDPASAGVAAAANATDPFWNPETDMTWDQAVGRWVPAPPNRISPDGTRYISGNFEVVDAATGRGVHRISTPQYPNNVVAYVGSTIYMDALGGLAPAPPGLWKLDTATWKLTQISQAEGYWTLVDDRAAWGTFPGAGVRRLDLSTGKVTDFRHPNLGSDFAGIAGSGILVLSENFDGSLAGAQPMLIVEADGKTSPVNLPPDLTSSVMDSAFQDGSTIVFSVNYPLQPGGPPASRHGWGLAAWDPGHGLRFLMKKAPPFSVAGPCLSF